MKIFIIGPEGSGKTVLLAMLSRYVATERKDLVLEPLNHPASKYVVSALAELEKGDWPPSTCLSALQMLQWRFGLRGAPLNEIVMFDAAGQDLCPILMQSDATKLTEEKRATLTQIDSASVLVYLLDLNGFLSTKDRLVINDNAWLFKTFLTRSEWRYKKRLVVISKADLYDLHNQDDAQIRDFVKRHLPKDYTIDHLVDQETSVRYLAVTSVKTITTLDANGDPIRMPSRPLKPVGIGKLVDAFRTEIKVIAPPPIPPAPPFNPISTFTAIGGVIGGLFGFVNMGVAELIGLPPIAGFLCFIGCVLIGMYIGNKYH